jgi:hypothetical protein
MDHRVARLRTPTECEIFARNATARKRPDLALEAQRRAVDLKVSEHGDADTPVEKEALAAIYAHEAQLTYRNGKKTRATPTWEVVRRHGLIEALQRAVSRPTDATSYETLLALGMEDLAFEATILRHPESFSAEAISAANARVTERSDGPLTASAVGAI